MNLLLEHTEANKIILGFEIIIFIIGIILITVSLLRNNQAQAGLSALNGGNEELFLNRKERGLDRLLSQIIF